MEKEPTMNEIYAEEIKRMQKLGYTDEQIRREISRMIDLQNRVYFATL